MFRTGCGLLPDFGIFTAENRLREGETNKKGPAIAIARPLTYIVTKTCLY